MDGPTVDFFYRDDVFDFIVRHSQYIESFADNKDVIVAKTLSGRYDICYTENKNIDEIKSVLGTGAISAASILLGIGSILHLESSGIIAVENHPYIDLFGQGVIIGFVDTGIDYTQDVFKYEDGSSKIISIFDQSQKSENPVDGFSVGTEYTREQISAALASDNPYDIVPQRDTSGHGTFLASVAAGRRISEDFSGAAPDCEIIAVKLREARPFYRELYAIPDNIENVYESTSVMVGIDYIIQKARQLRKPVVICLGLGSNSGSHDGFSLFEEYLSGVSNIRGVCICNSCGNECQARHHMAGKIEEGTKTANIDIKVGEDGGNIYLTIWNSASDKMSVSLISPTGETVGRVPSRIGFEVSHQLVLEPAFVSVEYHYPVEGTGDQLTLVKVINATPGIWTFTLYGDLVLNGTFNCWLPITRFGTKNIEFLSATPYGTITVPGTMLGGICCGAYDHLNRSLFFESSWGPTRSLAMSPDLVAPGVRISGYYPTGPGAMSGTSVASAITAGACALVMEWGIVQGNDPSLSTYQIRAYLIRGCTRKETISYPNTQWGYGELNLMQTFLRLRETLY